MIKSRQNGAATILTVVLWASLAFPLSSFPADKKPPVDSRIVSLIARFPAQNTAAKDALAEEIIALGPEGIEALCRMLAPPGAVDDSKVRFALHGLAITVFSPRLEEKRILFVKSLNKALVRERSKDVQAFLIGLIRLTGKRESIKPLRKYLLDTKLVEPAAQAVLTIGGSDAENTLLKALDVAPQANKTTVIKALGELRSQKATKKLLVYASSEQAEVRQSALFALANTGDPLSSSVLSKVLIEAGPLERLQAPSLYLLYARRLAESGRKTQAAYISRNLLKSYAAPEESHIACTALSLLVKIIGRAALDDLFAALDEPAKDLRGRALELMNGFAGEDVTARLVERMSSAPPETQAQILSALEIRGDKTAFPAVQNKLKDGELGVRLAAIPAATKLGGSQAIPDLFAFFKSAGSEEIVAAERALLGFSKAEIVPRTVELLAEAPPPAQAALLRILAARGASEHLNLIYAKAANEDTEVRTAALNALERLAGEKDLPRLISLLLEAADVREETLLQKAV
ncbi:MAG: HEAT repeat domain-containing protein, partial [Acidobacteriota bacterium]